MANITLKGNPIHTSGTLPAVGSSVPAFRLVAADLSEKTRADFSGKTLVLNIFPSIDTGVCALSVEKFYQTLSKAPNIIVVNISKDLPFAQGRFCTAKQLQATTLSAFRSSFGKEWGVEIIDGPLAGLLSRAVVVVDANGKVTYTEQVPEITQEPDYAKVTQHLGL